MFEDGSVLQPCMLFSLTFSMCERPIPHAARGYTLRTLHSGKQESRYVAVAGTMFAEPWPVEAWPSRPNHSTDITETLMNPAEAWLLQANMVRTDCKANWKP